MCFFIYRGQLERACVMKTTVEKDCDEERGGDTCNETATYNVTAQMTRVISFFLILAITACVCK